MFLFPLKKLIGILLTPLNISLILLFIAIIFLKYNPKLSIRFLISGFLVLLLSSSPIISNSLIKPIEDSFPVFQKQQANLDYIVVLGCSHTTDHKRPVLTQLKVCSLHRLMEAHRIFQLHPEATLITSGYAFTDEVSNAKKVKEAAISIGIPENKIMIEERPKDTKEEAELMYPLLKDKRFALVTNAIHMPRAYRYFQEQQLDPIPAPTGFMYKGGDNIELHFTPNSSALQETTTAFYEILGRIAQWVNSKF